jgi:transaldolase
MSPLKSLIATGTRLWLDSVDPELVRDNFALGATGATSNPVIISDLLNSGRFDSLIEQLIRAGKEDDCIAWSLADQLVREAQDVFHPVWRRTGGDDGYVSFELNPLLEDPRLGLSHGRRVAEYIELGKHWSAGHDNRLIKVPATPAGLDALEELAAAGVRLNVTLVFTARQYHAARQAVWRGALRAGDLTRFKSVYSIFVSRIDVYTQHHAPALSPRAQGQVGIVNAKRIWRQHREFWSSIDTPLAQEIVFASTGTKNQNDLPWKYVEAFAGSDIETNPPATNAAVEASGLEFQRMVDRFPPQDVLDEIDHLVDFGHMEQVLMEEGIEKFAAPQRALLHAIAAKRAELAPA